MKRAESGTWARQGMGFERQLQEDRENKTREQYERTRRENKTREQDERTRRENKAREHDERTRRENRTDRQRARVAEQVRGAAIRLDLSKSSSVFFSSFISLFFFPLFLSLFLLLSLLLSLFSSSALFRSLLPMKNLDRVTGSLPISLCISLHNQPILRAETAFARPHDGAPVGVGLVVAHVLVRRHDRRIRNVRHSKDHVFFSCCVTALRSDLSRGHIESAAIFLTQPEELPTPLTWWRRGVAGRITGRSCSFSCSVA